MKELILLHNVIKNRFGISYKYGEGVPEMTENTYTQKQKILENV